MTTHERIVLACDIDGTLLDHDARDTSANNQALLNLQALIGSRGIIFGTATGRTLKSHQQLEQENPTFGALVHNAASFIISAVGLESHIRSANGAFTPTPHWPNIDITWDKDVIAERLAERPELRLQEAIAQGIHKVSFYVQEGAVTTTQEYTEELQSMLPPNMTTVVLSSKKFLDILPRGVDKGSALRHTVGRVAANSAKPLVVAAGDSMNDQELLAAADHAILPSNADRELRSWAQKTLPQFYLAQQPAAIGVLEGLGRVGVA